jgi:dinuclear metal center YbgI/SA1388 family protein
MQRHKLVNYLNDYLRIRDFEDYGPQGLQVEGGDTVDKITCSVDAAQVALEAAVAAGSDFHLVHHGVFWGPAALLAGPLGQRVRTLFKADVSLYAAHLALDAHPEVGNNAVLARELGIEVSDWWAMANGNPVGVFGDAPAGLTREQLVAQVNDLLGGDAQVEAHGPQQIKRIGIVSGGAAGEIAEAARLGIDTYLTGELSHSYYWDAAEYGLNVIYAGHYATETLGVQALAAHLSARFDLPFEFLDFPTGL